MASTLSAVSEKDSTFSNPLETIMEISSGLSQFRLDYLRVGSIAILSQNQMEKSRAILCTRHRHCNGKAFYSRSPSHPIVVLAANEFNGSSSKQKEEYCLVARVSISKMTSKMSQILTVENRSRRIATATLEASTATMKKLAQSHQSLSCMARFNPASTCFV